ncbi:MAG: sulfatase [Candidatus Eisenbacteria sp.]|nr:sulfatase [Candidatus Eisenbacteria bacterium]
MSSRDDRVLRPSRVGDVLFVAAVSGALGFCSGVGESVVRALQQSFYFNTTRSYGSFLAVPAFWYTIAGAALGALVALGVLVFIRRRRVAPTAMAVCAVVLLISYWGSIFRSRFFGSLGNALGHLAMFATALVLFIVTRRLIGKAIALEPWERRRALRWGVMVVLVFVLVAGVGGWAALSVPVGPGDNLPVTASRTDGALNVLLITIDTLRADRLGCYGYPLERDPRSDGLGTSPVLDGLAREGTRFQSAIVPMIATDPSLASIMTSLYPAEHGVLRNAVQLDRGHVTLAEIFHSAGYRTGAAVSVWHLNGFVSGLSRGFGDYFDRGFHDRFGRHSAWRRLPGDARDSMFALTRDAHATCERAGQWLGDGDERPFFLWVHLFDPHRSYVCHESDAAPFDRDDVERLAGLEGEELVELAARGSRFYDSEIRHADAAIGGLLEAARQAGKLSETIVVVVSDHGEHMDEARLQRAQWFGHSDVFEEACRVPLMIWRPGLVEAGVVSEQVSTMDIGPTLLELAGVVGPADRGWIGRSMVDLISGGPWAEVPLVIDANPHSGTDVEGRALRAGGWKFVTRPGSSAELYDLESDPDELLSLAHSDNCTAAAMSGELARIVHGWSGEEPPEPDAETREKLRALGYVH